MIVVGLVVGAGIFKAPSVVAANATSELAFLMLWAAGGAVALIGALCYAELASTYPSTGGDYHFLARAFGPRLAFLFAWARLAIMQTGSIALLAYVFGDYAATLLPIGPASSALYAAVAVIVFTALNVRGIRAAATTQRWFTGVEILGLLVIAFAGLWLVDRFAIASGPATIPANGTAATGLAMVFVLLTYGGWNEGAYVSAETRGSRRSIAGVLLVAVALITTLYLLVNLAYLRALGLEALARSDAVAATLAARAFGTPGLWIVSLLVAVSALTSLNATVITGARSSHALGRDHARLAWLGVWREAAGTPANALWLQGAIALALVALGATTRSGFATLVEYTAPVFWLFFVLTGVALFRLRRIDPHTERPFRVPFYPLTPLLFCASGLAMLWSSLSYTGIGALVGVVVLLLGVPVLHFARVPARRFQPRRQP